MNWVCGEVALYYSRALFKIEILCHFCCYLTSSCSYTVNSPQAISPLFVLFAHGLTIERGIMKDAFILRWHTFLDTICPLLLQHWHMACVGCVWSWWLSFLRSLAALLSRSMNRLSQPRLWWHETQQELWLGKKTNMRFVWAFGDWMQKFAHPHLKNDLKRMLQYWYMIQMWTFISPNLKDFNDVASSHTAENSSPIELIML